MMRATDATAQLMELSQAQPVGAVDDDGVRGRHIDAALDDGRTHQQIEASVIEVEHDLFQLTLPHLPVGDADPGLGYQRLELARRLLDGFHPVVQKIDLAATPHFAQTRFADHRFLPLADKGLDRESFRRCRGDQ